MNEKIFLISLGCAKNLVNSEQMLAMLEESGYKRVDDPADCDVAIVNTCGYKRACSYRLSYRAIQG